MPKINQEEYEVLKEALNEGYEWIARDSHNPLCTHRHKPVKQDHWIQQYWGNVGNGYKEIDDRLFQFIQWEDDEPYNIAELIKEYEFGKILLAMAEEETVLEIKSESEETEVKKDLEWLKEELNIIEEEGKKILDKYVDRGPTVYRFEERLHSVNVFRHLLDQLDEPEVLSQELPVIPKFVADYIDDRKEASFPIYQAIRIVREDSRFEGDSLREWLWTNKGQETFIRAWLDGYEVAEEREQKYYVDLESAAYVAKWEGNGQVDIYTDGISGSDEYEFYLTEQEIKDYDERYIPFMVPVDEVNND